MLPQGQPGRGVVQHDGLPGGFGREGRGGLLDQGRFAQGALRQPQQRRHVALDCLGVPHGRAAIGPEAGKGIRLSQGFDGPAAGAGAARHLLH